MYSGFQLDEVQSEVCETCLESKENKEADMRQADDLLLYLVLQSVACSPYP